MLKVTTTLQRVRAHYEGDTRELLRVLLNATSVAEASFALDALRERVPEKDLVVALNLREVIRTLPNAPFTMHVDDETLARTAGLTRGIAAMSKVLDEQTSLYVTTAGNLVLDIIIGIGEERHFWNPIPIADDYLNSEVVDHLVESPSLLDEVIALTHCMGVVWNPRFYLSLEDWLLEWAEDAYDDICDLF